jgi:hypothetical protein
VDRGLLAIDKKISTKKSVDSRFYFLAQFAVDCGQLTIFLHLQLAFAAHLHLYCFSEKISLGLPFRIYLLLGGCQNARVKNLFGAF